MTNCVFCQIRDRKLPGSVVYRDERVMAFMDVTPVNTGHVLVIPQEHCMHLADVPPDLTAHLFVITQQVAAAVRKSGVTCEGINIFLADGEAAYQEVFHVHVHVIPRFKGDSFRIKADWNQSPSRGALDEVAAAIREAFE